VTRNSEIHTRWVAFQHIIP